MFDVLVAMSDTFVTFNECALVDAGNTSLVFVPYYEEEAKIVECVEKALRSTKKYISLDTSISTTLLWAGKTSMTIG